MGKLVKCELLRRLLRIYDNRDRLVCGREDTCQLALLLVVNQLSGKDERTNDRQSVPIPRRLSAI